MSKAVKDMIIDDLRKRIGSRRDMIVVNSSAMDAFANNTLRVKLQAQDITLLSVKNTLARRVLGEIGLAALGSTLQGPSTLIWGGPDFVSLTKEITKWAQSKKAPKGWEIKGGIMDGVAVSSAEVDAISKGPSREETIGKVVMLMLSPAGQLAGALLSPGGYLAGQVKGIAEKEPEAAAAAT